MATETSKPETRRYLYSGHSNAVAATIHQPSKDLLRDAPSGSLPTIGGHISHVRQDISFGEVVRIGRASIDIVGERQNDGKGDDHYLTSALSALEGVNILNIITADAIVGKVTSIYPTSREAMDGYHPSKFYFSGSHFDNLKINGQPYEFVLNKRHSDNNHRCFKHDERCLENIFEIPEQEESACLHIPQFGKIHFGELDVFRSKATLTMLRVELGSPYQGELTFATNTTNGHDG